MPPARRPQAPASGNRRRCSRDRGVLDVVRDGGCAAKLVADVLALDRDLLPAVLEAFLDLLASSRSSSSSASLTWPCSSRRPPAWPWPARPGQPQADALGEHRHPEGRPWAIRLSIEVSMMSTRCGSRMALRGELLADHRQGGPGRLPDAQGQVAGRAAHGHHQVHRWSSWRRHQVVDELDATLLAVSKPKVGAPPVAQVVVDVFARAPRASSPATSPAGTPRTRCRPRRSSRARRSPASAATPAGVQPPVRSSCPRRAPSGWPRGPDDRPALDVDPRHVRDGQGPRLLDPARDEVLEAVHDAEHVQPEFRPRSWRLR